MSVDPETSETVLLTSSVDESGRFPPVAPKTHNPKVYETTINTGNFTLPLEHYPKPILYADDLVLAKDGSIYFSDACDVPPIYTAQGM